MPAKPPTPEPAAFTGFTPQTLSFLDTLSANNNRAWFEANRDTYEQHVKQPLAALVGSLAFAFEVEGIALTGDAKRSVFRINRDVRFAKDKSPYKTNASCVLSRDGSKQGTGILYVQVGGQDGAFMALGFYGPEPDDLAALRHAIADRPKDWARTQAALQAGKLVLSSEDTLVRLPKGFEAHAGSPLADMLRLKSFVVRRPLKQARLFTPKLIDDVVAFAKAGEALLVFGRQAIDKGRSLRN